MVKRPTPKPLTEHEKIWGSERTRNQPKITDASTPPKMPKTRKLVAFGGVQIGGESARELRKVGTKPKVQRVTKVAKRIDRAVVNYNRRQPYRDEYFQGPRGIPEPTPEPPVENDNGIQGPIGIPEPEEPSPPEFVGPPAPPSGGRGSPTTAIRAEELTTGHMQDIIEQEQTTFIEATQEQAQIQAQTEYNKMMSLHASNIGMTRQNDTWYYSTEQQKQKFINYSSYAQEEAKKEGQWFLHKKWTAYSEEAEPRWEHLGKNIFKKFYTQEYQKDITSGKYPGRSPAEFITANLDKAINKDLKSRIITSSLLTAALPGQFSKFYQGRLQKDINLGFKTLPQGKKEEYGYAFTDWESIPLEEKKLYYGHETYFGSRTKEQKSTMIEDYLSKHTGSDLHKQPGRAVQDTMSYLFPTDYKHTEGYLLGAATEDIPHLKPDVLRKRAWENITMSDEAITQKYWSETPLHGKAMYSYSKAFTQAMLWPVTLTQTGVKYIRGKGEWYQPLSRIKTGKTFLPDVSTAFQKISVGEPSGLISVAISEGMGVLPGQVSSGEWEKAKQQPGLATLATGGEVLGLLMGSYGFGKAKVGAKLAVGKATAPLKIGLISRGYNIPTNLWQYTPTNLLRKGYWKTKTYFGKAKCIPEEQVWDTRVLSGQKTFAEASGASKQLNLFKKTTQLSGKEEILGIHTSPYKFRFLTKTVKGTSETPGLSISVYGRGSPHFLKTSGYSSFNLQPTSISLFPKLKMPTAPIISLKDVFRLPKSLRYIKPGESLKGFYGRVGKWLQKQPRGKYATIAGKSEIGGPEIEAIIRGSTYMHRTGSYYWTTYEGVTIPLPQYSLFGKGMPSVVGTTTKVSEKIPTSIKDFFSLSSYSSKATIPIISPSFLVSRIGSYASKPASSFSSSIASLKSSYSSYSSSPSSSIGSFLSMPSSVFSSYKSKASYPSKISYPSYKPSYTPSYKSYASSSYSSKPFSSITSYFSSSILLKAALPLPSKAFLLYASDYGLSKKRKKQPLKKSDIGYRYRKHLTPRWEQWFGG